jgi:5-methyltetrahydropteroyltriglutamate--homocysteine methyltransferase
MPLWQDDVVCTAAARNTALPHSHSVGCARLRFSEARWFLKRYECFCNRHPFFGTRRECRLPDFLVLGAVVDQTKCVALVPRRRVNELVRWRNLRIVELSYANKHLAIDAYWSATANGKRGHAWCQALLARAARRIVDSAKRRFIGSAEGDGTMQYSREHILTTHAGSLPRPTSLIELNGRRQTAGAFDEERYRELLKWGVIDVVRRQKELGVDVPGDGEYGKAMGHRVNYGAWWHYSFQRLGGLDPTGPGLYEMPPRRSQPGEVVLTSFADRRDRQRFAAAYADPQSGITTGPRAQTWPVCVGPLTYTGHQAIADDIANFKAALTAGGIGEGFMTSIAPGSASRIGNAYYRTEEEFIFACAEAMREEYKAIIDAGLILQLDDPSIAENWDQINPEPTVDAYRKFTMLRVEALNAAIKGLPEDRIRFHLCWGSWHGPHTTDIAMKDIVYVMLAINCGAYSFEAANVRHDTSGASGRR